MGCLALLVLLAQEPTLPSPGGFSEDLRLPSLGDFQIEGKHRRRFGWQWDLPKIDPANESFVVMMPTAKAKEIPLGLFVYISPGRKGWMLSKNLPLEDLKHILDERNLVYIAPNRSENQRNPLERLQLAMMATTHAKRLLRIDENRVVVGGMSGGAKMACIAGRFAPEHFRGVLSIVGASFHEKVFVDQRSYYPPDMRLGSVLNRRARSMVSYAFVSGPEDFNWMPIQRIQRAYEQANYRSKLYAIEGLGHEIPGKDHIASALDFLLIDEKK